MVSGLVLTPRPGWSFADIAESLAGFPGLALGPQVGHRVAATLVSEPGSDPRAVFDRLRDAKALLHVDVAFVSFEDETQDSSPSEPSGVWPERREAIP